MLLTQPYRAGDTEGDTRLPGLWGISGRAGWHVLARYNDVTRQVAAETGSPLIDLASTMPHAPESFTDMVHYTKVGAGQITAQVLSGLCPILATAFPGKHTAACP